MDVNVKRILPDRTIDFSATHESSRSEIFLWLIQIIEQRQLTPNFQPIISMATGEIYAYEGLIRGPSNSPLHSPLSLFRAAGQFGLLLEVERLCRLLHPKWITMKCIAVLLSKLALESLPVVEQGIPIGIITRNRLIDAYARPYWRELYGKKSCTLFMDSAPLVVDKNISLQELSNAVVAAGQRHLSNGFIITDRGQYLGVGTGHDLLREITQLQITAARYANPLTLLPGNVPIDEHIDRLLERQIGFCVCYCDLDAFKPFNDIYGYRRGDEIIQVTSNMLSQACDLERDFIGHIGGDDFIILFQSLDWEIRCRHALANLTREIIRLFKQEHCDHGGYFSIDRKGQRVSHSLITLSIGAVLV